MYSRLASCSGLRSLPDIGCIKARVSRVVIMMPGDVQLSMNQWNTTTGVHTIYCGMPLCLCFIQWVYFSHSPDIISNVFESPLYHIYFITSINLYWKDYHTRDKNRAVVKLMTILIRGSSHNISLLPLFGRYATYCNNLLITDKIWTSIVYLV